jgi:GalNAc5-diNAcBac-PP-undecaprenol beta-1,3-glucosyltransferase
MKGDPFFSVVIPVYNRVDKLKPTLSSILQQSFTDFEIVIIDDGSDEDVRGSLSADDSMIRIIRQENSERGAARNAGFRSASGKYVVFFDSDDLMHVNHLEVLSDHIIKNNYPAFIATKFDFVDEAGRHRSSDMADFREGYYDYHLFLDGNPLACNVTVKKETKEIIMFEEDRRLAIKEDRLFLISNMRKNKIYIIDAVTVSMLDHAGRSMRSGNQAIILKTKLAAKWIIEKVPLDITESRRLLAHVNYFCGIHSYLDNNRNDAITYSRAALRLGGIKFKYISLFLKSLIGRKLISAVK